MTKEKDRKKECEDLKNNKKKIKETAESIKEKLDKVVEDIKKMESNTKGLANAVGFDFSLATIENGTTIKKISSLKEKIDAFVNRSEAIEELNDITDSRKLSVYAEMLEKIEKKLESTETIKNDYKDSIAKKMEQDLTQVIHDSIAKDKKEKNLVEIEERKNKKIGAIDKLRNRDELIKAENEFFQAQNKLIDSQSVDYDSENYLEKEYAKVIAYGEEHKTEDTQFATFYKNIKLIEGLLDKEITKKAIEVERKAISKEVEEYKRVLSLKTKDRIEALKQKTEEIESSVKNIEKPKSNTRINTMETARALLDLDNLVGEINDTMAEELQNNIANSES